MADRETYLSGGEILFKDDTETTPLKLTELRANYGKNLIQHSAFWDINNDDLPVMWELVETPNLGIGVSTLFPELGGKQITIENNSPAVTEGIKTIVGATQATRFNVQPATTYSLRVAYKVNAGDTGTLIVQSYADAVASTEHLNSAVFTSETEAWYTYTFTTSATANNLLISFTATAPGDIIVLAHPKLEQGPVATPYVLNEAEEQANIIQYYKPYARAYLAGAQINLADSTATKVLLETESMDLGSNFDTGNNKFVTPIAGIYRVNGQVSFANILTAKLFRSLIYVDGGIVASKFANSATTTWVASNISYFNKIANNKDIELYALVDTGVNTVDLLNGAIYTFLEIELVTLDI